MLLNSRDGRSSSLVRTGTLVMAIFSRPAWPIAANRKLLQDTQYHARRAEYDALYLQQKMEKEAARTYRVVGEGGQCPDLSKLVTGQGS